MTLEQLIAFNVVLLVAVASPGPALLTAIQTSLSAGRATGVEFGAGLGLMAAAWTLMALVGLGVAFELFPILYIGARIVGALYLLYFACKMWRDASVLTEARIKPAGGAFLQGLLVNLANPKSVLFAGAVLVTVFPVGMSFTDRIIIVVNHLFVEVAFYTALACAMSTHAVATRYMRARLSIDRVAAVVVGTLGLRILFSEASGP